MELIWLTLHFELSWNKRFTLNFSIDCIKSIMYLQEHVRMLAVWETYLLFVWFHLLLNPPTWWRAAGRRTKRTQIAWDANRNYSGAVGLCSQSQHTRQHIVNEEQRWPLNRTGIMTCSKEKHYFEFDGWNFVIKWTVNASWFYFFANLGNIV